MVSGRYWQGGSGTLDNNNVRSRSTVADITIICIAKAMARDTQQFAWAGDGVVGLRKAGELIASLELTPPPPGQGAAH
jgi:hypothetical protein